MFAYFGVLGGEMGRDNNCGRLVKYRIMSLYAMDVMISRANVPVRVACLREIQIYLAFIHYFYIRPLS